MDFQFSFIFAYVAIYTFVAVYCLVLMFRLSADVGRDLEVRFFRIMLGVLFGYSIVEGIWAIGNFGLSDTINRLTVPLSVFNHCMVVLLCYYWFCFVEARMHTPVVDKPSLRLSTSIPLYLALLLTISSIWTGLVFFTYPDGAIGRGPLYLFVEVIAYGYALVATIRAIAGGLSSPSHSRRVELIIMATFAIPPAVAGVVDSITPMMPIMAPAFFLSLLIIFTVLQEMQIFHDSLTGLNNRRRADRYFEDALERADERNPLYFFMVDCNSFKQINDTYGHLEGDRALRTVAAALKDACANKGAFVARWGGDEFVIITFGGDVPDPDEFANNIQDCLLYERMEKGLPYSISVSVGYSMCQDPKYPMRQLVDEADKMLYREKSAHAG